MPALKLKRCPFCGGKPIFEEVAPPYSKFRWWVRCFCGIATSACRLKSIAATIWNRRKT